MVFNWNNFAFQSQQLKIVVSKTFTGTELYPKLNYMCSCKKGCCIICVETLTFAVV